MMENTVPDFTVTITIEEDFIILLASGTYSLSNANYLFKHSIDSSLLHNKRKILIDVTNIRGTIPFFDRFQFAENLAIYKAQHALAKVNKIAVVGHEPIIHKDKFGETVAVNRGVNARTFTDMSNALIWLTED